MQQMQELDDWWKQAVVYQIYPRSFKDSNQDGIGDIAGITSKISYLDYLGVDAIWLSPFYPSELVDGGYDVIDYRNVDPRLGTMADFDTMAATAHSHGIKVIVDIVPNHTSDHHPWFQEALASPKGSEARNRYIFRDGRGPDGSIPPTDWISEFGGSAWKQVEDGQWYLHIFASEQPDLNWKNADVREDFKHTLRFWSDHGTDGFRIDVAHGLAKDVLNRPLEELNQWTLQNKDNPDGSNPLWDRPEVHDIYREWRKVFDEYTPARFAVGEAWVEPDHQYRYASKNELGQVFNFEFAKANWNSSEIRDAIEDGLQTAERSRSTATWVMSNHDLVRHASRYALPQIHSRTQHQLAKDWVLRNGESYEENRVLGTQRAKAAILLEMGLPGSIYIYQGEELGLFEVADIPWDRLEDPTAVRSKGPLKEKGRDGCRVPLPWDDHDSPEPASWNHKFGQNGTFGFSTCESGQFVEPHLPQPMWFARFCVNREESDPSSMLSLYRQVIAERARLLTEIPNASLTWLTDYDDPKVIAYTRSCSSGNGKLAVITNFGEHPIPLPAGSIVLASVEIADNLLPRDATAWILLE